MKWAAGLLELLVSRLDEFVADALALVFRKHGHGAQACPCYLAHGQRAVHDVTDDMIIQRRHQGQRRGSVGPQGIDDVRLLILLERTFVQVSNGRNVGRTLSSNFD